MNETDWATGSKTVVGFSTATGIFLYGGFGLAGLVLGYFLPSITGFALSLPWVPFEGPMKLINAMNGSWVEFALALLGLVVGLVVASISIKETLVTTITDKEVQFDKDGHLQSIARQDIYTIFLDGKELVILGDSGYELARELIDEAPAVVMEGFEQHSYPWNLDGDPYKDVYRRWVPEDPGISPSANALLKVREKALEEKNKEEINDLRSELAKLGYVVRDEKEHQYWRQVPNV